MKPEVGSEGHPRGVGEGSQGGERVWSSPPQHINAAGRHGASMGSAFAANSARGGGKAE